MLGSILLSNMIDHTVQSNVNVFSTPLIKEKIKKLPLVSQKDYREIHREFLTPLDMSVDCNELAIQIDLFAPYFKKWGNKRDDMLRSGCALCNIDGKIDQIDNTIGSLFDWCKQHPNNPILESDCRMLTPLMQTPCLSFLHPFTSFFYRSSILKWEQGAHFTPHIDNHFPYPWIRLWATTDERVELNYWSADGKKHSCKNIQKGRLYIIDTSLVHEARWSYSSTLLQLFICLSADSMPVLKKHILK